MNQKQRDEFEKARRQSQAAVERVRRQSFVPQYPDRNSIHPAPMGESGPQLLVPSSFKQTARRPRFKSQLHEIMFSFTESKTFGIFILLIILLNTSILIAQTWQSVSVRFGWYATALDHVFLGIYIMEILVKVYVWRRKFFEEGWNVLDFVIVLFGIADFVLPLILQTVTGFDGTDVFELLRVFKGVRAFRALRVLRTIRFLATLQVVLTTLLQSIRSIGAIVMLMFLFMYVFAVVGRGFYAKADPIHFGNIGNALFTLFQLLTLDDWFEVYGQVLSYDPGYQHIMIYLVVYIVMEYFIFLNLFVAVLVDNFQLTLEAQNEAKKLKHAKSEESDDDDDNIYNAADTGETHEDIPEVKVERKSIHDHYPYLKVGTHEMLAQYFRLLTSLECNNHTLENQQRILDMMVEICNTRMED